MVRRHVDQAQKNATLDHFQMDTSSFVRLHFPLWVAVPLGHLHQQVLRLTFAGSTQMEITWAKRLCENDLQPDRKDRTPTESFVEHWTLRGIEHKAQS